LFALGAERCCEEKVAKDLKLNHAISEKLGSAVNTSIVTDGEPSDFQDDLCGSCTECWKRARADQPSTQQHRDGAMSSRSDLEANKDLFLRYQDEVVNKHDTSDQTLERFITADFVDHSDRQTQLRGYEAVRARTDSWLSAFPDSKEVTTRIFAERDLVAVMYTASGNHSAPYLGIPATRRDVAIKGIRIVRVESGRLAESWAINDYLAIATQLESQIAFQPIVGAPTRLSTRARPAAETLSFDYQMERFKSEDPEIQRNQATLLGFQKNVFNAQDWRVETLARYLKPDIIDHNAFAGDPPGLEGVAHRFSAWKAAFDDSEEENAAMVGEGDTLAVLYHLHATHSGSFMGIGPTKRHVVIPGIEILRFENGMMAEHWGIYDFMVTAQEIGTKLIFKAAEFGSVA
jgi:predicted ester cyclase